MNPELKLKLEAHFDYRWRKNKNSAFTNDDDLAIMDQLPEFVKERIYKDYMYIDFLKKFRKTFYFPNFDSPHKHAMYNWQDEPYKYFMFDVLNYLEPRKEEAHSLIMEQNEEVNEVLFFDFGMYAVGFEINRVPKFALKFKNSNVINAYACTYN